MGCVLIIDDDTYLRTALKKNLIRRELDVIDSGSPEDAIVILQNGYMEAKVIALRLGVTLSPYRDLMKSRFSEFI